jgi:hypothetical protein
MQAGAFALVCTRIQRRRESRVPVDGRGSGRPEPDPGDRPQVIEKKRWGHADDRGAGVPRRRWAGGRPNVCTGCEHDAPRVWERRAVRCLGVGGRRPMGIIAHRAERDGGPRPVPDRQRARLVLPVFERPHEVVDEDHRRGKGCRRCGCRPVAVRITLDDAGVVRRRCGRPAADDGDPRHRRGGQDGNSQQSHVPATPSGEVHRRARHSSLRSGRDGTDDGGVDAIGLTALGTAGERRLQQLVGEHGRGVHRSCTCNARSRARRAVKSRDLTVPGGMPSRSPTSARDRPS